MNEEKVILEKINKLIPQAINTFQAIIEMYAKKNRGENISSRDFINIFAGITQEDFSAALTILQIVKKKHFFSVNQVLNSHEHTSGYTLPGQSSAETASRVVQAMLQSVTSQKIVPVEQMIETLKIEDPELKKKFKNEYEKAIKHIKTSYHQNPVDANLYLWARLGKFLFYGGIVVIILIILRKIYEFVVDVTDTIRNAIVNFIKPSKSRYYLSFMKFIKKYKNKKPLKSSLPGGVVVNINKGQSNKYDFQEQFPDLNESDLE